MWFLLTVCSLGGGVIEINVLHGEGRPAVEFFLNVNSSWPATTT